MKHSGIARKLDKLGRIVVPIEARRSLEWKDTTPIEINLFGRYILLHEFGDRRAAPVDAAQSNPMRDELYQAINALSDKDTLIILDLLRRFSTAENSI